MGCFICTFSLIISLSFTFKSSKFNYSSSSKCSLTGNSNESVQLSFHYLKRDRTRRCFLFSVTCHIRIFWNDSWTNHLLLIVEKTCRSRIELNESCLEEVQMKPPFVGTGKLKNKFGLFLTMWFIWFILLKQPNPSLTKSGMWLLKFGSSSSASSPYQRFTKTWDQ